MCIVGSERHAATAELVGGGLQTNVHTQGPVRKDRPYVGVERVLDLAIEIEMVLRRPPA